MGLTQDRRSTPCPLTNEKAAPTENADRHSLVRERANESFGVAQTPTFFINGKKLDGVTLEDFERRLRRWSKS